MANLIYQGKINRQFWGKLIRQSTSKASSLQCVIWGGGSLVNISNRIIFFYSARRIE